MYISIVFYQSAKDGIFHTMWNFMDANPDVFTDSNAEGIERVQESGGKYAFFMESASIEYIMERHCELARVGRELDAKGYGIGEIFYLYHPMCRNETGSGCPKAKISAIWKISLKLDGD